MMLNEDYDYLGLLEFSNKNHEALKALNLQTIRLMQNDDVIQAFKKFSVTANMYVPQISSSMLGLSKALNYTVPRLDSFSQHITESLQTISSRYKELLGAYSSTLLSASMRAVLESAQITSIAQLCLSHETSMIHDAIGCFANAQYEYLPDVFNQAMARSKIGAADVAFIKTGTIIPVLESKLAYPRGFRTSINALNKATASDIADNSDIEYDTKKNRFISSESEVDSKSMNIVCAGIKVFDSGELFTEVELMNFISFLSRTPMGAALDETGKKIYVWLCELYAQKTNQISFDRDLYYHCRSRQKESMPFTFDEMMKAPYGLPGAGRFNQVGRPHFYFASTKHGAEVEVKKHLKKDEVLQTVMIRPVKEIRLLDLSQSLQRGVTFLKWMRYPLSEDKNQMPREYLLPCYVADC